MHIALNWRDNMDVGCEENTDYIKCPVLGLV